MLFRSDFVIPRANASDVRRIPFRSCSKSSSVSKHISVTNFHADIITINQRESQIEVKRLSKKANNKMQSPHRHACVGSLCRFQDTAERVPAESLKTGRCASVKQHCGNGKRRRRASNLPANKFQNQYNSKCS